MWFLFACVAAPAMSCQAPINAYSVEVCRAMVWEFRETAMRTNAAAKVTARCVSIDATGKSEEAPKVLP